MNDQEFVEHWKALSDMDFIQFWRKDLASKDAGECEGIELSVFYNALERLKAWNRRPQSPPPVAPVRKWEADDVIGQTIVSGKVFDFYFGDATKEVQDALNGRKA